ncbi:MAG: hypothetical protein JRI66_10675 [Deltaproteobacteria bacterium]|nr:hypothetical protein [Deltaproteobacteria bacterium]
MNIRRSLAVAVLVFLVWPCWVFGQNIPLHLVFLNNYLTKECGYSLYSEGPPNVLIYGQYRSAVTVGLDYRGNVRSGTVLFMPGHHRTAPYKAIGALYVVLQYRLGKLDSLLNKRTAHRKGYYLLNIITHNLKIVDQTEFNFDDMIITATKNPKNYTITVRLRLWDK